jgi:hypothetical protein
MIDRLAVSAVAAGFLLLTSCSGQETIVGNGSELSGSTAPVIPPIDAACSEILAAIDYFGEEQVFRAQVDDLLTVNGALPEDAPARVRSQAVLANRDLWSLCAFDVPQFAEDVAADSPSADSPRAFAIRETLMSQGIHVFDEATDSAIDILGRFLCSIARPLQPLSTTEIMGIAENLVERYGRMTTLDAAKVFLFTAPTYCPNLDMSGGQ